MKDLKTVFRTTFTLLWLYKILFNQDTFFLSLLSCMRSTSFTLTQRIVKNVTHIIMKSFCFTGVFTSISPFRSCTVQVPKYTVCQGKIRKMSKLTHNGEGKYHHFNSAVIKGNFLAFRWGAMAKSLLFHSRFPQHHSAKDRTGCTIKFYKGLTSQLQWKHKNQPDLDRPFQNPSIPVFQIILPYFTARLCWCHSANIMLFCLCT